MTSKPKEYGMFFLLALIIFGGLFTMLIAGFMGAFASPETGTDWILIFSALPGGFFIGFVIACLATMWYICQNQ
ncbi:MAG: hypothetical protein ACFE7R_08425 [Candidatus Hodarchaeota archaeon]